MGSHRVGHDWSDAAAAAAAAAVQMHNPNNLYKFPVNLKLFQNKMLIQIVWGNNLSNPWILRYIAFVGALYF